MKILQKQFINNSCKRGRLEPESIGGDATIIIRGEQKAYLRIYIVLWGAWWGFSLIGGGHWRAWWSLINSLFRDRFDVLQRKLKLNRIVKTCDVKSFILSGMSQLLIGYRDTTILDGIQGCHSS